MAVNVRGSPIVATDQVYLAICSGQLADARGFPCYEVRLHQRLSLMSLGPIVFTVKVPFDLWAVCFAL